MSLVFSATRIIGKVTGITAASLQLITRKQDGGVYHVFYPFPLFFSGGTTADPHQQVTRKQDGGVYHVVYPFPFFLVGE